MAPLKHYGRGSAVSRNWLSPYIQNWRKEDQEGITAIHILRCVASMISLNIPELFKIITAQIRFMSEKSNLLKSANLSIRNDANIKKCMIEYFINLFPNQRFSFETTCIFIFIFASFWIDKFADLNKDEN